jgi:hypothetical protein
VQVRRSHETVGPYDRLEDHALAVVLRRGLVEDDPLAGDGILDLISCVEQRGTSWSCLHSTDRKSLLFQRREIVGRKADSASAAWAISTSSSGRTAYRPRSPKATGLRPGGGGFAAGASSHAE